MRRAVGVAFVILLLATGAATRAQTPNRSPVALFDIHHAGGSATVTVNASRSWDPDGTIAAYAWDWGDNFSYCRPPDAQPSSGALVSHTYACKGIFQINLTVTDDQGATGWLVRQINTITNVAPVANFTANATDLAVDVDASASRDPDGTFASYAWDWGDGTNASGVVQRHAYAAAGTFAVRLTVWDDASRSATAVRNVTVTAPPPTTPTPPTQPSSGPSPPPEAAFDVAVQGLVASVDAGASRGDGLQYAWDWGDAASASAGVRASHAYAAPGERTITLTVTAADGQSASAARRIVLDLPALTPATDAPATSTSAPPTEPPAAAPATSSPPPDTNATPTAPARATPGPGAIVSLAALALVAAIRARR